MSLSISTLLNALAAAQAAEVAPALQLMGQPGAPDANYAGGTASTTALLLILLANEQVSLAVRDRALAGGVSGLAGGDMGVAIGDSTTRDGRARWLGARLAAGDARALDLLTAEAQAEWQAIAAPIGLPLPVPVL